jgi:hypothetical protein
LSALKTKNKTGFIALMSAIIISVVLLVLATTLSVAGFFSRFNVLDAQYKQQSSGLARGCIDAALLQLAQDPNNITIGDVSVGSAGCSIIAIQKDTPAAGEVTIKTKAVVNQAATNFQTVVNGNNLALISIGEVSDLGN